MKRPRGHPIVWTHEMDEALLRFRGRMHAEEAARRVGVSSYSMYRRLRQLGVQLRPCVRPKKSAAGDAAAHVFHQQERSDGYQA